MYECGALMSSIADTDFDHLIQCTFDIEHSSTPGEHFGEQTAIIGQLIMTRLRILQLWTQLGALLAHLSWCLCSQLFLLHQLTNTQLTTYPDLTIPNQPPPSLRAQ